MKSSSKILGQYLRRVKLFPGATISTDGSLILLVDVNRLAGTSAAKWTSSVPSSQRGSHFRPWSLGRRFRQHSCRRGR